MASCIFNKCMSMGFATYGPLVPMMTLDIGIAWEFYGDGLHALQGDSRGDVYSDAYGIWLSSWGVMGDCRSDCEKHAKDYMFYCEPKRNGAPKPKGK